MLEKPLNTIFIVKQVCNRKFHAKSLPLPCTSFTYEPRCLLIGQRCFLFLQNLFILKRPASPVYHRRHKQIVILSIEGLLLILLFIMMMFAMAPFNEQFGEDDIPFLEIALICKMAWDLFSVTSIVGFELGGFLAVVRVEYLRGHIGEKRFADGIVRPNSLFILRAFLRRLLIGPSFLYFPPTPDDVPRLTKVFASTVYRIILFKEIFLT